MVELVVEVAFNAGVKTPAEDRVWTDITDYVEGDVTITYGRSDELSTADANSVALTLDNSDGRFTPDHPGSPYHPGVKLGRPIRVSVVTAAGTRRRFTGFVDAWPVQWDGTDETATSTVTATSGMAQMGMALQLRSGVEYFAADLGAVGFWPMNEDEGALVATDVLHGLPLAPQPRSGPSPTFGVDLGSGRGVRFNGRGLEGYLPNPTGGWGVALLFQASGPATLFSALKPPIGLLDPATQRYAAAVVAADATLHGRLVVDGRPHLLLVTDGAGARNTYLDGDLIHSEISLGPPHYLPLTIGESGQAVIGNVIAFNGNVTAAQAATLHQVMLGTTTTAVVAAQVAGYAGRTITVVDEDATLANIDVDGAQALEVLRLIEISEGGVLHENRDGALILLGRHHRYHAPVALTIDAAAQQLQSGYAHVYDRQGLTNDVTVTGPAGIGRAVDASSIDDYGLATSSWETSDTGPAAAAEAAGWAITNRAQPRVRVPSLTVDVLTSGLDPLELMALDVSSRIRVTNLPVQASSDGDFFVEGYTELLSATEHTLTFNVSPAVHYAGLFVLEDPTAGQLDDDRLAW